MSDEKMRSMTMRESDWEELFACLEHVSPRWEEISTFVAHPFERSSLSAQLSYLQTQLASLQTALDKERAHHDCASRREQLEAVLKLALQELSNHSLQTLDEWIEYEVPADAQVLVRQILESPTPDGTAHEAS